MRSGDALVSLDHAYFFKQKHNKPKIHYRPPSTNLPIRRLRTEGNAPSVYGLKRDTPERRGLSRKSAGVKNCNGSCSRGIPNLNGTALIKARGSLFFLMVNAQADAQ